MGNQISTKSANQSPQSPQLQQLQQSELLKQFSQSPQSQQFQKIIGDLKTNFLYDFIKSTPPSEIPSILSSQSTNNETTQKLLKEIATIMLKYNDTWKFGNNTITGNPQSIMKKETYNSFLGFIRGLLQPQQFQQPQPQLFGSNKNSYESKQIIVKTIHDKLGGNYGLMNIFFTLQLSTIFPNVPQTKELPINVTLLGLAAIIGAEHIAMYYMSCGANPGATYRDENKDTATLMLSYQISLSKINQSQLQPSQNITNYFIVLPRILYILFLLGSVKQGVDLSAIFLTNDFIEKKNQGLVEIRDSILHQLVKIPQQPNIQNNKEQIKRTLLTGASIDILFAILDNNNPKHPIFFENINQRGSPLGYTILYSLLINSQISDEIKLGIVYLLVAKYNADPTNFPKYTENARFKGANTNLFGLDMILYFLSKTITNKPIIAQILQIFSINQTFGKMLKESNVDLSQFNTGSSNQNKNRIIQALELRIKNLEETKKELTSRFSDWITLQQTKIASAIEASNRQSSPIQQPQPQYSQPQQPPKTSFLNRWLSKNKPSMPISTILNPVSLPQYQQQPTYQQLLSQQQPLLQYQQQPTNQQLLSQQQPLLQYQQQPTNQQLSSQQQPTNQKLSSQQQPLLQYPQQLTNQKLLSQQQLTNQKLLSQQQLPMSSQQQLPMPSQQKLLNRSRFLPFGQPVQRLNNSRKNLSPQISQAAGKKIQLRTFHFLKYKKYSERAFTAERPIIAADNAYDFMKLHYNIGDKQVTFAIHDRVNNKKYKYVAKTLKDGTNVIKSRK